MLMVASILVNFSNFAEPALKMAMVQIFKIFQRLQNLFNGLFPESLSTF